MAQFRLSDVMEVLVVLRLLGSKPDASLQDRFLFHCLEHASRSHSQFLQDLWVLFELQSRRNGFFVEFGGADGVKYSNTLMLEREYGWNGIVAEPARVWHPAIERNRGCSVDARCVWSETGRRLTFNQTTIAAHSTLEAFVDADMHAPTRTEGQRYEVETVSLNDLLTYWRAPRRIDYLSIDTEGSELEILQAFDFEAWDVRAITVEHNHTEMRRKIFDLLTAKGYVRRFRALSNVDDWYLKSYEG